MEEYRFIHHFVPHPHFRTRAKLLSHSAIFTYCMVVALLIGVFRVTPRFFPGVLGYASNINVSELLKLTNAKRANAGLPELRLNKELTEAAILKGEDMFKNNYWAHVSPKGTEPWDFILSKGYDYSYAGENLAKNFNNSREVVEAWYRSPSHKENLLSANYDEVGYAVVNGVLDGYETTLVVQFFGRPRDFSLVATKEDEAKLLESYSVERKVALTPSTKQSVPAVLSALDVQKASKYISFVFGGFMVFLLTVDIWYSRKKAIYKFTGHTFAHLTFLIVSIISIWFVLSPGKIL